MPTLFQLAEWANAEVKKGKGHLVKSRIQFFPMGRTAKELDAPVQERAPALAFNTFRRPLFEQSK